MMSRRLYAFLLWLLSPVVLGFTLWRAWRRPAYRERWWERFGWGPRRSDRPIWIHAVSVGETIAAIPLVRALQARYPEVPILMTSTTPTGAAVVSQRLGTEVLQYYLPYDLSGAVTRFLRRQRPRLGIIMETEIWPNLCHAASREGVPLMLVNARLSQRSLRGYARFRTLFAPALASMNAIAAQSSEDAAAFRRLGAKHVVVTGNIKYDLPEPVAAREHGRQWQQRFAGRPVWVFASTHAGEEQLALAALEDLQRQWPDLLLVLIPRHPSRRLEVMARMQAKGVSFALRSRAEDVGARAVFLIDTLGEVMDFYAAADVVTIGGSFVPAGGHNPLEAAALARPVTFGPYMDNFKGITQDLLAANAAVQVLDVEALVAQLGAWLTTREPATEMGDRALVFLQQQRGALGRTFALLDRIVP